MIQVSDDVIRYPSSIISFVRLRAIALPGALAVSIPCLFQSFLNRVLDKGYSKSALDGQDLCLVPVPDVPRRKRVALKQPKRFRFSRCLQQDPAALKLRRRPCFMFGENGAFSRYVSMLSS